MITLSNIYLQLAEKEIFNDFSLEIKKGEKVRITGKSGSGKSTLMKILLGFQKIQSGSYFLDGKGISGREWKNVRNNFAYVNQDVTIRPGKIKHFLKEVSEFSHNSFDGEFDPSLMEEFDFDPDLLEKDTGELSGGERQRFGILLAIMLKRPVFLLDEITSALDPNLKKRVVAYFSECPETVIIISHDREWNELGNFRGIEC